MITFSGYEKVIEKVYDHKQEHVFEYWEQLLDVERKELLDDLAEIDFDLLKQIYSHTHDGRITEFQPAPYITLPSTDAERKKFMQAHEAGEAHIREGKVAAFLVAGGQGSRLGYDGPKGKFPVGPVSGKTLFHFHAEKIASSQDKYGVVIPFFIMTSRDNHQETETFFREQDYFGLSPVNVHFFTQNMIPSLDLKGKLILSETNRIFMNPDGHGGSLTALRTSGALNKMQQNGIETVSYFQVDNPLVKIIDPLFIGFHVLESSEISSKALKKASANEKTGVFVAFGSGKTGIVEYSDLTEEQSRMKGADGELIFSAANPAIHLFSLKFIESITGEQGPSLPYHTAKKKIPAVVNGAPQEISGYKYEKFVFDALPLSLKNVILETPREEEFAPVKNAAGTDSVETAHELMEKLYRNWIISRGIKIPPSVRVIEISPRFALCAEDIPADLEIPSMEKVYLE
ncbi:MAG TPA: UDPGP type 1 family protein [Spirochaetota bacterium]|nr:UDPGP type 1 family protein [Spirochaetota bacterium]